MNRHLISLCTCILLLLPGFGQKGIQTAKRNLAAYYTPEMIIVDGLINEPIWQTLPASADFTQVEPRQGEHALFRTIVRLAYNDKNLYIAFVCYDTVGRKNYKAVDLKRDFDFWKHDVIGVTIDGFNDNRNAITFYANPYGAQRDYQSFDDLYFDVDWNGLWMVKTNRTDSAWTVEMQIPWKTLRYRYTKDSVVKFGINFQRVERTVNEKSAWASYPRSVGFNRMEYAGILTGIVPPKPTANVQVNLYSLADASRKESNTVTKQAKLKTGGEIKWVINPNLVADVTFNTDFAQADVDRLVNNLSRFSVFFPERRQFFLENASLFSIGLTAGNTATGGSFIMQPFFSRRIGLDSNSNVAPIDGGIRTVYRSGRQSAGMMVVRQRGVDNVPAKHFFVSRYNYNFGTTSRVGLIVSGVTGPTSAYSNANTNITTGVDGLFRLDEHQFINVLLLRAGNTSAKDKMGTGGYIQYNYLSNLVHASFTQFLADKNFDMQTGFVSRQNVIASIAGAKFNLRKKWLPFKKMVRDFRPGLNAEWYFQASDGLLTERTVSFTPLAYTFQAGGYIDYTAKNSYQQLFSEFAPLGANIPPGKYLYTRHNLSAETNPARKLAVTVEAEWGRYYNGKLYTGIAALNYAPLPFVSVSVNIAYNQFSKYYLTQNNKDVTLLGLNSRLAVSPQLQFTLIYQFNTLSRQITYNARFSWEYKPLSYFFIVLNSNQFTNITRQSEQSAIIKLSYLKQF